MKVGVYASYGMIKQAEVTTFEHCDALVAAGIKQFANTKDGYGVANRQKPIWRLLGHCLDEPVLQFSSRFHGWASTELLRAAKGVSRLAPAWREVADGVCDADYIQAKRMLKHDNQTHLVVFIDTLASLRDVVLVAMSHESVCVTVPGGGARLPLRSKSDRHYPFCELCWRYSAEVREQESLELKASSFAARDKRHADMEAGKSVGSLRFCALHNPGNPKLQYRADLTYRERFWSAITECKRRVVQARKLRLAEYDDAIPLRVRQVLALHAEGVSEAQIEQVTLLSPEEIRTSLGWLSSDEYQAVHEAETRFRLPDERLLRQAAYLLVHGDVQGLLGLESELPGLAVSALQDKIHRLFKQKLSARTLEIVQLSRLGLAKAEIAKSLGMSRQAVHNSLSRESVMSYMHFLDICAEADSGSDYRVGGV